MRLLYIGECHAINIETISDINCAIEPYIKITVNGTKLYDLRYTDKNYEEFRRILLNKLADNALSVVDMSEIKKEVEHL